MRIMSRRPTHFQLLSHRFARPQDLLVILLAGPDQRDRRVFFFVGAWKWRGLGKIRAGSRVQIWSNQDFCMFVASQQNSLIFMSRFSRNLVVCRAFPRSSVFCNFLIWTPFFGQPWTNSFFHINFFVFLVEINLRSQNSKPSSPVQEPRKIPQMIHQNSIGFHTYRKKYYNIIKS